jgi:hypothetical protein
MRTGIYKNWQMGRITAIEQLSERKWELTIKALELCFNNDKEEYVTKYDLTMIVKKTVLLDKLRNLSINQPVVVGYYIQSYKSPRGLSYTILSLRALEPIMASEMNAIAKSIWKNKNDPFRIFDNELDMKSYFKQLNENQL